MNIDHLKCFLLVAENLSFARAAEALYISQPAVTKQISALENELGTALFLRSTRHVELTPAGMSFYKDAKDIVLKSQLAVERLQRQNAFSESLSIGLSNSAALSALIPILTRFHREYPQLRPHIEVQSYKIILNLFLEEKLDILFYYKENMPSKKGVRFQELEKDRLVCIMPSDHPMAKKKAIALDALKDEELIACNPLNAPSSIASFQKKLLADHAADKVVYCSGVETAVCMASAGMGVAVLPSVLVTNSADLSEIPLEEEISLSFGVFYHSRSKNTVLKNFLKIIL